MVEPQVIAERLRAAFPDATKIEIEDLTGTRDHYKAVVVAPAFASLSRVEQHRAIYRALADLMTGPIHALALDTHSPESWAAKHPA